MLQGLGTDPGEFVSDVFNAFERWDILEIGIGVYDGVTEDLLSTDIRDVLKEFLFNGVVVLDVVI